jgi:hypothetical protein
MAEVTAMRNNALPYPIYGAPFTIVYPFRDADGDLVTGATTPDAEISKNGDTFADCTNESTEIATNSGVWYLSLTGTELTCDVATIIGKSASAGMKTAVATLYPRKLVTVRSGTSASAGTSTSTIVFDASASAVDDYYNGMVCIATIDSNLEARVISDYTGSTQTATVVPDWNVAPDSDDTFVIKLPEGAFFKQANVLMWNGAAIASPHTAGYPAVTIKDGTGTGEIDTTSGGVLVAAIAANAITATSINADAITAAKIADGAIDSGTFATGAITAAAIAADAIGASELAADAVTEIQSGLATSSALTTVGNNVSSILADTGTDGVVVASINANAITATSIATDAITATKIAADAIGASELAADAVTEIQSGLATAAALQTVDDNVDAILVDTGTDIPATLTTIDDFLDLEVAAILAAVDTEVAAIKAKTDLIPGTQDGKTFAETVLLMAAALLGKASGLGSTTAIYRSLDDAHDRITATVDSDGNRTAVTLDASSP